MAESDDLRVFMREIATRHERVLRDQSRFAERIGSAVEHMGLRLEEQARALRQGTDTLREATDALREVAAELRDTRDERRAHTAALWTLIDRLNNGGAQA